MLKNNEKTNIYIKTQENMTIDAICVILRKSGRLFFIILPQNYFPKFASVARRFITG